MPGNNFTILIAEDDADDQAFITDAIQRNHFEGTVSCVSDGSKLMRVLLQQDGPTLPSLILLDLNMPFKDGYTALSEIKQDGTLRGIPVIVLTSSSSKDEEQRCYALGAERFYSKPLNLQGYDMLAAMVINFVHSGSKQ